MIRTLFLKRATIPINLNGSSSITKLFTKCSVINLSQNTHYSMRHVPISKNIAITNNDIKSLFFLSSFKRKLHTTNRLFNKENNKDTNNKDTNNKEDNENKNNEPKSAKEYFKSKEFQRSIYYTILFTFLFNLFTELLMPSEQENSQVLTFQDFKTKYMEKGLVSKIYVVNKYLVEAELVPEAPQKIVAFTIGSVEFFEDEMDSVQDKLKIPIGERIPIIYVERQSIFSYIWPFIPTVLLLGGLYWLTKKVPLSGGGANSGPGGGPGGIFGVGKSKAKLFNQETDIKVKFKDVAGCDEAKGEIMEFVHFLKNPEKYTKLGAKIPRGAILSGPPGTGKTLLAKATAGEAGVPFLSVSGSEFVEMFVGVGASRVRDLFKKARELAPSIIFIDEIDAIGKERGKGGPMGGANDEREATLNQLLVEMDGFDTNEQVVVLAGTNRPDVLDKALMRPGRFDRHIQIDNPDVEGRKAIYKVHLASLTLDPSLDKQVLCGKLAALTPGFSGADIANCCNEAALIAARNLDPYVVLKHFEQAIERVIAGLEKKTRVLSPQEKKTVAYHEAGHAVCGWLLKYADPLIKVSIIPRGQGALGYAQYLPPDQYLVSEIEFIDKMIMALGGRVSEELHFKSVTSGAHDDFKKVTNMAASMVTKYGMSRKVGYISYNTDNNSDANNGFMVNKPFSEVTYEKIDSEIKRIVDTCHENCKKLLTANIDKVDRVAKLLLDKEVLTRQDMINLLGPRPYPERNDAFEKYLDGK